MIIQPSHYYFSGEAEIVAVTRFLLPSFEVNRAHLLGMPFNEKLCIIPWEEHWNPYSTLLNSWLWHGDGSNLEKEKGSEGRKPRVMVDDEMRDFIQRGLSENGFEVVGLGGEVEKVKQVKTEREIGILRAVNTGTMEAIRAVRGCLYLGLSEDEVKEVLDNTLRAGGLEPFFDIVLFGEFCVNAYPPPSSLTSRKRMKQNTDTISRRNASNPHGGTNGSKILERTTFILIDVGYFPLFPPNPYFPFHQTHNLPGLIYTATPPT
jgi:Xaa-Pro aminopeptidase